MARVPQRKPRQLPDVPCPTVDEMETAMYARVDTGDMQLWDAFMARVNAWEAAAGADWEP